MSFRSNIITMVLAILNLVSRIRLINSITNIAIYDWSIFDTPLFYGKFGKSLKYKLILFSNLTIYVVNTVVYSMNSFVVHIQLKKKNTLAKL